MPASDEFVRIKGKGGVSAAVQTGLIFPKNGDSPSSVVAFRFTSGAMPNIQPLTVLMKVYPYAQTGFHTTFFHSRADGSLPTAGGNFFGAHPYPPGGSGGSTHNWEIAYNFNDYTTDVNGNSTSVTKNQWYAQACSAENVTGDAVIKFYWNLGVSANRLINPTVSGFPLTNDPTSPALTFGDAPWSPQNERLGGILRGISVWSARLTEAQITTLSPLETNAAVLSSASSLGVSASLWYLNMNPTPSDITDKSGAWGSTHDPAWVTADKATLWTG